MSALLLSFLISLGASGWVFSKLQNKTGYGNSKNAIIGAGVAFVMLFLVIFTLAKSLIHN